jgi:hypothetical protein
MKSSVFILFLILSIPLFARTFVPDTLVDKTPKKKVTFYDSLEVKASKHRFTRWLYGSMVCGEKAPEGEKLQSYDYYNSFKGKTIGSITVKSLKVFGQTFDDTLSNTDVWVERVGNKLHSNSNLKVIRKNLWIMEGQSLDPDVLADNERFLRSLPYMKDVRFIITQRQLDNNIVDILILTQDVFSLGISGSLGNVDHGKIGIYDKNVLGIGHEISATMVGNTAKTPHVGFETSYAVNNLFGNFINFSTGYSDTYTREGYLLSAEKDFLRPQSINAGGMTFLRNFSYDHMNMDDVVMSPSPLNYVYVDGWYGRKLNTYIEHKDKRFQMTLAGRFRMYHFYERPLPDVNNEQYFSDSKLYLASLSLSHRSYSRDSYVYSFGITEDIPKGYLCEFVAGYDHNEFGDRGYSHVFLSSGNMFTNKPFYFYSSLGVGGFFNKTKICQGIIDAKFDFISRLFNVWNIQARQFIKMNYTLGINRFDIETLLLKYDYGIQGFSSQIGQGTQRLTLNFENVLFQKKSVLGFQSAFFTFLDLGLAGSSNHPIFQQKYYTGFGFGLRVRNENLAIKTIQLRVAFYPNHPSDVPCIGFVADRISKTGFYSFQPRGPEPLKYQ